MVMQKTDAKLLDYYDIILVKELCVAIPHHNI